MKQGQDGVLNEPFGGCGLISGTCFLKLINRLRLLDSFLSQSWHNTQIEYDLFQREFQYYMYQETVFSGLPDVHNVCNLNIFIMATLRWKQVTPCDKKKFLIIISHGE